MRCITKQTKEDALKLLECDFSVLPKEFEERKAKIKYFLDNFKKVERICMFSTRPYEGLEVFAKNNKLEFSSILIQFIKSKLERYEAVEVYHCKEDGEYYVLTREWGSLDSDVYYMDKIELLGVYEDKIIDIGKLKSYSKSGLEETVWLYLIAYDLGNLTMLEFMKDTFLEHRSNSRLKYHYKKIFQQEGLSNVYTLVSLLSKNNYFETNDWFTDYYVNKKMGHNNSKMIIAKNFKTSVEYVEDFTFDVTYNREKSKTNTTCIFVGVVDMQNIEAFNESIKHVESVLRTLGKSETFYVSDVQDTYVFIYKGEVISLPYDLRERIDSPLVKNQINIAKGYPNNFYDINKVINRVPTKKVNRYSTVGTTITKFKKYCESHAMEYNHFEASLQEKSYGEVEYIFKYKGINVTKIYDTLEFYEEGKVSSASFKSACIRNGWDINDFKIISIGNGKHKCIHLSKVGGYNEKLLKLHEARMFNISDFKHVCYEYNWDISDFEFIRQDTNPLANNMKSLQEGFYIHKDRLTEFKRIELEVIRLRKIEEKYNNILENILKNS